MNKSTVSVAEKTIQGDRIQFFILTLVPLFLIGLLSRRSTLCPLDLHSYLQGNNLVTIALALFLFVLGLLYEKIYLSPRKNLARIKVSWTRDILASVQGFGGRQYYDEATITELLNYSNREQNLVKLGVYYSSSTTVRLACFLACSAAGYILASTEQNLSNLIPFVILTYLGFAQAYPSMHKLNKMVELAERL